mgnify:FL=1
MIKKRLVLFALTFTLLISIFSVNIPAITSSSAISTVGSGSAGGSGSLMSDKTAPSTIVTHFTNTNEINDKKECVLENGVRKVYLNYNDVVGHGKSIDASSPIDEIITKLDKFATTLAVCEDDNTISCEDGEKTEIWHTQTFQNLAEGEHMLSGKAQDILLNAEQFNNNNK